MPPSISSGRARLDQVHKSGGRLLLEFILLVDDLADEVKVLEAFEDVGEAFVGEVAVEEID